MSVIIFLIILAVLILVHEFGHFIVAKKSGIKVTEFGLGFPPRIWGKQKGETTYTLNAIPFGGFVKIFGEDPSEESISGPESHRSIVNKNRFIQVAVLAAGVFFNCLFAWLLISAGYMAGLPTPTDYQGPGVVQNVKTVVTSVAPNSPADRAGVKPGDAIESISSGKYVANNSDPDTVSNFIEARGQDGVTLNLTRGKELVSLSMNAENGVVEGRQAVGIAMESIGTLRLPIHLAIWEGLKTTIGVLENVTISILGFLGQSFRGHGDLSQITGPVGIVGLVGDVSRLGVVYLLSFTALISLNLAVINLLPLPALDGGRIVIVALEGLLRRRFPPKAVNVINNVGFVLLILLMLVVTAHDIYKII